MHNANHKFFLSLYTWCFHYYDGLPYEGYLVNPLEAIKSVNRELLMLVFMKCQAGSVVLWPRNMSGWTKGTVGIISHTEPQAGEEKLRKIIVIHQVWEEIKAGRWDIIGNVIIEAGKKGRRLEINEMRRLCFIK